MANRNRRTKARREKEFKEAKHQKVVDKPIYKRPWIWIALAALVIGIVVPSAYQYNEQQKEARAEAAAEAKAKQEAEPLVWESVLESLEKIGVTESAISEKSFDIRSTADNGEYDTAQVTFVTNVRTLIASALYQSGDIVGTSDSAVSSDSSQGSWLCTQITNEDNSHIYWTFFNQGVENATQAAVYGADGTITSQPLYDYVTDEPVAGAVTGSAVETTSPAADAEISGAAADGGTD
ncbi:MAG: hypothetical protein LBS67_01895 [Clostridiales Family XIII bacterium]|jgi:hypothetical protein|nr:hypothetical protein [Clostridiales Family XIII bacterium]